MARLMRVVILKPSKYMANGYVERFRWGFMPNSTVPHPTLCAGKWGIYYSIAIVSLFRGSTRSTISGTRSTSTPAKFWQTLREVWPCQCLLVFLAWRVKSKTMRCTWIASRSSAASPPSLAARLLPISVRSNSWCKWRRKRSPCGTVVCTHFRKRLTFRRASITEWSCRSPGRPFLPGEAFSYLSARRQLP